MSFPFLHKVITRLEDAQANFQQLSEVMPFDKDGTLEADSVGTSAAKVTIETVTVLGGAASGTATVVSGAVPLGILPSSNQDQFVDNVAVSGTTLTVTLAANATADNTFKVPVLEP